MKNAVAKFKGRVATVMQSRPVVAVACAAMAFAPMIASAEVTPATYGLPTLITELVTLGGAIFAAIGTVVILALGGEVAFGALWKWGKKLGGGR